MNKLYHLAVFWILMFSHVGLNAQALPTVENPIAPVETDSGLIAGKVLPSGIKAWLGVPYAQAPVRELRWRAPQAISWDGVYNADRFAPQCIQPLRGSNINHYFGHEATSEDCLYLNIWAPEDAVDNSDYPVVVWIYGGGFTIGSASMRNYAGEELAKKGVVYVSVSYRIGALGFMAHPELSREAESNTSGNYGFLDQVAALQWVNRNIREFGGDPDRVTIMGQSAGSGSVSSLQVSPLAKGLFHGIVGMSGSAVTSSWPDRAEAEQTGLQYEEALGVSSIAELRHVPADRILAMQEDCQLGCLGSIRVGPSIDGYVLPAAPSAIFQRSEQIDVPVLIGFTRDEGFSPIGRAQSVAEFNTMVQQGYGEHAQELFDLYPISDDADVRRTARDVARDSTLGVSMYRWAELQNRHGEQPAYGYLFARVHPYTEGVEFADHDPATVGSYHTADVPYWLQTLDSLNLYRQTRTYTAFDHALSDFMSDSIVAFARSGNPSTASFIWPKVSAPDYSVVRLGLEGETVSEVIQWPNIDSLPFFLQYPASPVTPPAENTLRRARD